MERVVGRAELGSGDESSRAVSPDIEQLRDLAKFDFVEPSNRQDAPMPIDEEEELDFVLFAPQKDRAGSSNAVARIRVQTPPLDEGEPGFLVPDRPEVYYFAQTSEQSKRNFAAAAVSASDVVARARNPWPGSTYEWKMIRVPATKRECYVLAQSSEAFAKLAGTDARLSRRRPGKKARIKVRQKLATAKAQQEQKQKEAEVKDAAEREKRTRRNREKKVKKKQREKAKKAEGELNESSPVPD